MARTKQTARLSGEDMPLRVPLVSDRIARKSAPVSTGVKSLRRDSNPDSS